MALNAHQEAAIARANRAQILEKFSGLPKNWRKSRWLAANNRYATNTIDKLTRDTARGARLRHAELASYIAASAAIHSMDGWSYLARAIEADLSGDVDAARHLAYYAELRAAMSLLASAGIGVFNSRHISVGAGPKCERVAGDLGTHKFVWEALACWGNQPAATDLILKVVQPAGRPLAEWLGHFAPTAGIAVPRILAGAWLRNWGLDLQRLAADREARNESSYRPAHIAPRRRHTLAQSLKFIEDLWRANEPSNLNAFKVIDRYLLRNSLAFAFKAHHVSGLEPSQDPNEFARLVEPVFHNMLPTPGDLSEARWRRLLDFSKPVRGLPILLNAAKMEPVGSPTHHMQVMSRAAILLRVSTGATRELIRSLPATELAHLGFWWRPIGEMRGLWDSGSPPPSLIDLWQDIDESLDKLQTWRRAGGTTKKSLFNAAAEVAHWLSSCERIALWGLGL